MKKNPVLFLLIALLVVSLSLVACKGAEYELTVEKASISLEKGQSIDLPYQLMTNGELDTETKIAVSAKGDSVTYNAETKQITAVKAGRTTFTITVEGRDDVTATLNVNVPEYSIEITGGATAKVNLGDKEQLTYTIRKDGVKISETEKQVDVSTSGNAISYESVGDFISFVAVGEGTVTVALKDDPTVFATRTYTVEKSFWSSAHSRATEGMTFTEDSVIIPGGGQHTLSVMDGGHKFVFKATLKIPTDLPNNQSIGIGSTKDAGDSSLWFGFQGSDTQGKLRLLIKNFYAGWSNSQADQHPAEYAVMTFDTDTFDCTVVRDGLDYWYNIGGMIGTFRDTSGKVQADEETWIGIYSQTRALTVTNFSYSIENDDIAAAKEACAKPVAFFDVANKAVDTIVKGDSYTYTASVIYAPNVADKPVITWEADVSGVTAGTAEIGASTGTLTVSEDAAGVVKITAKCGGKEVSFDVTISTESLAKENDVLSVNGGVELDADGSIVFPETRTQGMTLSDTAYQDVYYSAKLKAALKGDFTLSFTVSNLAPASDAKLLVSLGGVGNNFFISNNKVTVNGQYVNGSKQLASGSLTANFTAAETLEVVIKVVGGHYEVTVNETKLSFGGDVIRRVEDYVAETPALITVAAGTSCKVDDITLTDDTDAEYIVLNDNTTLIDNGFTTTMVDGGWDIRDNSLTKTIYALLLPDGDYTLSLKVAFSAALADGKLSVNIGGKDFYINNKLSSGAVVGQWHDYSGETRTDVNQTGEFDVKLKKIGSDMYFFIGNTRIGDKFNVAGIGNQLCFWAGNFEGSSNGATATVTELTVTQGAVIITIDGTDTMQVGETAAFEARVLGSQEAVEWSIEKDGLTAGQDGTSIAADGRLTLANDAEGYVVVVATLGDVVAKQRVNVSQQPTDQDTALAESVGGVKQDVANGKLIFDNADKDGVNEEQYDETKGYHAILNSAANERIVIHDNFIIEFTVSDYVTNVKYPKLMISLGGRHEQFFVVYNREGHVNRIETYAASLDKEGTGAYGGQWVSSDEFASFDNSIAHKFTIKCEDGFYTVYVDDVEIQQWKMDANSRVLVRNPETMLKGSNIMLSTNKGTTCTVSGISVKSIEGKEDQVAKYVSRNITENNGSITINTVHGDWNDSAGMLYTYGAVGDNCEIAFDVKFSDNMSDGKLCVKLDGGVNAYTICLENGNMKVEVRDRWGGIYDSTTLVYTEAIRVKITITNGVATMTLNDTYTVNNDSVNSQGVLSFYVHNKNSADYSKSITISNIVITDKTPA